MTQQWKPIESAPKDGSRVLIWHPDYCAPITAQWYGSEGWKMDSDVSPFWQQPTHWMPLPAEPSKYAGDHDGMEDDPRTHWQQPATPPASAQDDAKDVDARWYAVGRDGAATLCTCEEDARETAAESAQLFPNCAPYTAVQLIPAPAAGDARAVAALAELVACDRIKKQIASMQACVLETDDDVHELDAMMSDLARRQPAAWDAARAVVAASQQQEG